MNLPFILDVVLGLMFIYLILSLLASEIQELFSWSDSLLGDAIRRARGGEAPGYPTRPGLRWQVRRYRDRRSVRWQGDGTERFHREQRLRAGRFRQPGRTRCLR